MWANYHTHSNFCDGTSDLQSIVQEAIQHGVKSLGFSSHAPLPFETKWSMRANRFGDYLQEIKAQQQSTSDVQIFAGLEVDYIPGVVGPNDYRTKLDYTIGSVHFVEKFDDGVRWEIDGTHQLFLEGLEKIFQNDIREAVSRYYEITRLMIANSTPDILGHLDKIKIQNVHEKFFSQSDKWYREAVEKTLDVIHDANVIVEVNTRGIYQRKSASLYPEDWILYELLNRGIPVTISSDAHHPKDLVNFFPETAQKLLAIGIRKISILSDGSWQPVTLNPDGFVAKF